MFAHFFRGRLRLCAVCETDFVQLLVQRSQVHTPFRAGLFAPAARNLAPQNQRKRETTLNKNHMSDFISQQQIRLYHNSHQSNVYAELQYTFRLIGEQLFLKHAADDYISIRINQRINLCVQTSANIQTMLLVLATLLDSHLRLVCKRM